MTDELTREIAEQQEREYRQNLEFRLRVLENLVDSLRDRIIELENKE